MNFKFWIVFFLYAGIIGEISSCKPDGEVVYTSEDVNKSPTEGDDWISIFDGSSLDGWRGYNEDTLPSNWIMEEGSLKTLGTTGGSGGDIIYALDQYDNFELTWSWKLSTGGNSGVFYHVVEGKQYHAPYENAPEYQVLDDLGFPEAIEDWQKVGVDYAMYTAEANTKLVKPAGEWNTSRILFTPQKAEHWLNGQKLLEFVPWSEDWHKRKNEGKWRDYPDYGMAKTGYISIQDHGSPCWFKDIKIRKL